VLRIVTGFSVLLREKSAFARADRWQASTSWWFLVRVHALHARADRESSKNHRDPIDKRSLVLFLADPIVATQKKNRGDRYRLGAEPQMTSPLEQALQDAVHLAPRGHRCTLPSSARPPERAGSISVPRLGPSGPAHPHILAISLLQASAGIDRKVQKKRDSAPDPLARPQLSRSPRALLRGPAHLPGSPARQPGACAPRLARPRTEHVWGRASVVLFPGALLPAEFASLPDLLTPRFHTKRNTETNCLLPW
jgi:hypothetical protein